MPTSKANRHAQSKDPLRCITQPIDKSGGPVTDRPPPNSRASLGMSDECVRRYASTYCPGITVTGTALAITGPCASPERAIHANHLSRLRRHQPHAPRQHINALGIAQRRIFQPQRVVHLRQLAEFPLRRFDLVAVLNRLEMLPGISKDQQEQAQPARCQTASSRGCAADLPP